MTPAQQGGPCLSWDVHDKVGHLVLSRPASGNAVNLAMARELGAVARRASRIAARDELRCVVLSGSGRRFCVGGDVAEFAAAADPHTYIGELAETMHRALNDLADSPAPVISIVHGAAAGAGLALAFGADIVLSSPDTHFRAAYTAIGLSPDCGVSWLLARRLGTPRAMDLLLTNRAFTAGEAQTWGLISRLVDGAALLTEADQLASAIGQASVGASAAVKHLVRHAHTSSLRSHMEHEARQIADLAGSVNGREGVRAFLDKRTPNFTAEPSSNIG